MRDISGRKDRVVWRERFRVFRVGVVVWKFRVFSIKY